jgi:hypothetical protein
VDSKHIIIPKHTYRVEHWRDGKCIWTDEFHNLVTTEGKNTYLDYTLKTGQASPTWYIGLVNNASFSQYVVGDVMNSHAGWIEDVDYNEANRQAFTPGTISAGSVDNSASKAIFTMNASVTIRGSFLTTSNTKSGTSGKLMGTGDFSVARAMIATDQLITTLTASIP